VAYDIVVVSVNPGAESQTGIILVLVDSTVNLHYIFITGLLELLFSTTISARLP
jgi:hypothetical protein